MQSAAGRTRRRRVAGRAPEAATSACSTRVCRSSTSIRGPIKPFRIGSKWLAYNGELYNYLELRDELRRTDHGAAVRHGVRHRSCSCRRSIDWAGLASIAVRACGPSRCTTSADGSNRVEPRFASVKKPLYVYRDATARVLRVGGEVHRRAAGRAGSGSTTTTCIDIWSTATRLSVRSRTSSFRASRRCRRRRWCSSPRTAPNRGGRTGTPVCA